MATLFTSSTTLTSNQLPSHYLCHSLPSALPYSTATSRGSPRQRPLSPLNPYRVRSAAALPNGMQYPNSWSSPAELGNGNGSPPHTSKATRPGSGFGHASVALDGGGGNGDGDGHEADSRSSSPPMTSPTPAYQYHTKSHVALTSPPSLTFSMGTAHHPPPSSTRDRARQPYIHAPDHVPPHAQAQEVSLKDQMWKDKFRQRCLKGPRWTLGGGEVGGGRAGGRTKGKRSGAGSGEMGGDGIPSGSEISKRNAATNRNRDQRSRSVPKADNKRLEAPTARPRAHHGSDLDPSRGSDDDGQDEDDEETSLAENEEIFRRLMLKENRVKRHRVDVSYEREMGGVWSDPIAAEEEIRLAGEDQEGMGGERICMVDDRFGRRGEARANAEFSTDDSSPQAQGAQAAWDAEEVRRMERDEAEMEAAALQAYMESLEDITDKGVNGAGSGPVDDHGLDGLERDMEGIDWDEVLADDGLSGDEAACDAGQDGTPEDVEML